MEKQNFTSGRGGKREGAGRPVNKEKTVCFHRRIKPEWVKILDEVLDKLKEKERGN